MCAYLFINRGLRFGQVPQVVCRCKDLKLQGIRAMSRLRSCSPLRANQWWWSWITSPTRTCSFLAQKMNWVLVRTHGTTKPISHTDMRRIKRASKMLLRIAPESWVGDSNVDDDRFANTHVDFCEAKPNFRAPPFGPIWVFWAGI